MILERQMEDLIAASPEEFFPGHGFALRGRQKSFAGVGRFDLLFTDRYETNILMELKAVTARYENATQLAKYKDALEAQGERNILMWLVAPDIPKAVREFLDRVGIEYSEIHEAQFRRIAVLKGVELDPPPKVAIQARPPERRRSVRQHKPFNVRLLPNLSKTELETLISEFKLAAKRRIDVSLANHLRAEILNTHTPGLSTDTALQLARWCNTSNPVYRDGMEVAKRISALLFGKILDRNELGT
jgi:hypothetical protein